MSTVIGLEDLIQHINIVYPNRLERQSDESSDDASHQDGMTSRSSSHLMPLDLVDIKKEQRRLAALLDIKSRDPLFGVPKPKVRQVHPAPKNRCIICSLPKVDRKSFSGGSFGPWAGIAIPRIPETEIYNIEGTDRCPEGCEHQYTDGAELFGNYSTNSFQFPTLETEIILDETSMRLQKDRFKLPPIFDATSRSPDPGQLIALSSDKTFFNTQSGGTNYTTYSGAFSGPTRSSFLSRIQESSTPVENPRERRQPVRRNTISESDLSTRVLTSEKRSRDRRRRVSTQSEILERESLPSSATLRYHYRQPSDLLTVPLNTPDTQLSEQEYADFTRSKRRTSRELTFEFVRDGSSVYSRDTTVVETPDDVWSRVQSASWCKCLNVDLSKTRCSECLKIGGHQRWCISKLGLCPSCGKVVKTSMSVVGERRVSRSPTFTFQRERSGRSPPFSPRREVVDHGAVSTSGPHHPARSKPPSAELKVRFSGTDYVRPISPLESRAFEMENEHVVDEHVDVNEDYEQTPKSKKQKPKPLSRPSYQPDIHKHAYELALSDSRVLKHKKEKDFEKTFTNSLTTSLFSYFPKWRRPQSKSIPPEAIGLRDPDNQSGGKTKVKKGMKHILGKIKIEDYYAKGKKPKK